MYMCDMEADILLSPQLQTSVPHVKIVHETRR